MNTVSANKTPEKNFKQKRYNINDLFETEESFDDEVWANAYFDETWDEGFDEETLTRFRLIDDIMTGNDRKFLS